MKVEKLHSLLIELSREFRDRKIGAAVDSLATALSRYIEKPDTVRSEAFKKSLSMIEKLLESCRSNDMVPSRHAMK